MPACRYTFNFVRVQGGFDISSLSSVESAFNSQVRVLSLSFSLCAHLCMVSFASLGHSYNVAGPHSGLIVRARGLLLRLVPFPPCKVCYVQRCVDVLVLVLLSYIVVCLYSSFPVQLHPTLMLFVLASFALLPDHDPLADLTVCAYDMNSNHGLLHSSLLCLKVRAFSFKCFAICLLLSILFPFLPDLLDAVFTWQLYRWFVYSFDAHIRSSILSSSWWCMHIAPF